jgi:hypothetical protein
MIYSNLIWIFLDSDFQHITSLEYIKNILTYCNIIDNYWCIQRQLILNIVKKVNKPQNELLSN